LTGTFLVWQVRHSERTHKAYSAPADWYTLGVLIYELAEQNLPFGDDPHFDKTTKYRKPQLLGENGKPDPDLHDLVLRLLEPAPAKRLGSNGGANQIKEHAYWRSPEWDLVEMRALPSPLYPLVARVLHRPPNEEKLRKQRAKALETASAMAAADQAGGTPRAAKKPGAKGGGRAKAGGGGLGKVEEWSYASPDAITQEYIETAASCVSII